MRCRPTSRVVLPTLLVTVLAASIASIAFAAPSRSRAAAPPDLVPESGGRIPLFVETTDGASLTARVEELGGTVQHVFENVGGLSVLLPANAVAELEADPRVASVERQRFVHQAVSEPQILEQFRKAGRSDRSARAHHGAGATSWLDIPQMRFVPVDPHTLAGPRSKQTSFLGYDFITGAADAWEATGFGEGSLVVVVDTGIFPDHPLIEGNVIGGINMVPAEEEQAIDVDDDGIADGHSFDWNALENDDHGTFCAGLIAGHADLEVPADDVLASSVAFHSPESVEFEGDVARIHLMGAAPSASLYAIKVFPFRGGSAPDARVGAALDYLISAKKHGDLDVDVISMSLSGPVLNDGRYFLDRLVDEATRAGMTCVVAAGNEGPAQLSVGSPGSAKEALTVGAAIDPLHLRVAIETLFGLPVGGGDIAYPHDMEVVDFSSCGLTADWRVKPGLLATGLLVFSATLADFSGDGLPDAPSFGFGSGTSFSTPTVAGAAALCAAFEKSKGRHGHGSPIANALMRAAQPIADFDRVSGREQGAGFVRVPEALEILEHGGGHHPPTLEWRDPLVKFVSLEDGSASASSVELSAGETYQIYVRVPHGVGTAHVSFPDVTHVGDENPFLGDQLVVAVHSAKRGGTGDYVFDSPIVAGAAFDWEAPEAGMARVTFSAAPANYGQVAASVEITTEPAASEPDQVFCGMIRHDGHVSHTFQVPKGLQAIAIRASWEHDWSRFPTYDLDLFLQTPDGIVPAASLDSPETAYIESPTDGEWTLRLLDFSTVRGREPYRIEVDFIGPKISGETQGDGVPERPAITAALAGAPGQETEVRFAIPRAGRATLDVFDVTGRRVRRLTEGVHEAGDHAVTWDEHDGNGHAVAAGVYFLRLATDDAVATRKVVLMR